MSFAPQTPAEGERTRSLAEYAGADWLVRAYPSTVALTVSSAQLFLGLKATPAQARALARELLDAADVAEAEAEADTAQQQEA